MSRLDEPVHLGENRLKGKICTAGDRVFLAASPTTEGFKEIWAPVYDDASGAPVFANGAVTGAFSYAFNELQHQMSQMSISDAGVDFIKGFEQFRGSIYLDQGGLPTIGYGHLLVGDEATLYSGGITEPQAVQLLRSDLAVAEAGVRSVITGPISQNQYDAMVSFAFNAGVSGLNGSRIPMFVNAGRMQNAAESFGRFTRANGVYSRGLSFRRASEADMFLNGNY